MCMHSVNFLIPQWISALCINIVVYQTQAHIAGFQLVHHNTITVNQDDKIKFFHVHEQAVQKINIFLYKNLEYNMAYVTQVGR